MDQVDYHSSGVWQWGQWWFGAVQLLIVCNNLIFLMAYMWLADQFYHLYLVQLLICLSAHYSQLMLLFIIPLVRQNPCAWLTSLKFDVLLSTLAIYIIAVWPWSMWQWANIINLFLIAMQLASSIIWLRHRPVRADQPAVRQYGTVLFQPITDLTAVKIEGDCCICLDQIGPPAAAMPCGHLFHQPCLVRWLESGSGCPLCRQSANQNYDLGPIVN